MVTFSPRTTENSAEQAGDGRSLPFLLKFWQRVRCRREPGNGSGPLSAPETQIPW